MTSQFQLTEQFQRLRLLEDDWDGQGASVPDPSGIAAAERFLSTLLAQRWPGPARIFALSSGEVVAEWDRGQSHFEVEFVGENALSWMSNRPDQPSAHGSQWDDKAVLELAATLAPTVVPSISDPLDLRVFQAFIGDCVRREIASAMAP